jgi:crotonobetainyl-CoA:carnitine CoA-transferase CaiB-like acyl-CoA transferase
MKQTNGETASRQTSDDTDILNGIRVLDLTRILSGPLCSMMLAEFGADVITIEHPDKGDEVRAWPPFLDTDKSFSSYFATINRSKRSLALDLKSPEGLAIAKKLAAKADIVMESFTPGVADRLGLGYKDIAAINERVIYYSLSGFGQTGPERERRGFDPILQAVSGLMSVTGEKGGGPIKTMVPVADVSAATHGLAAIMGALFKRERTNRGQAIDISMMDVMVSMLSVVGSRYLVTKEIPPRSGTENPQRVPSAAFECADGRYVQISPNQPHWATFSNLLEHPEWVTDPRFAGPAARVDHGDELYALIRKAMLRRPLSEWLTLFDENSIVAGPINDLHDVFNHPQILARNMVQYYDAPGVGSVPAIGLPFKFSEADPRIRRPPPRLGEHSEEILKELGYTVPQIDALATSRVIRRL